MKRTSIRVAMRGRVSLWYDGRAYTTTVDDKDRKRAGTLLWVAMEALNKRYAELTDGGES